MIVLHHLGVSQSERIAWLLEELDIPYEVKHYKRLPGGGAAPPEYRALHPAGTSPVIEDGDVKLAETSAIVEYLLARYGKGRLTVAPDDPLYADYLFWLHYPNGSIVPAALIEGIVRMLGAGEHPVAKSMGHRMDAAYAMMESALGRHPYIAGDDFTAADVLAVFPITTMRAFAPRDLGAFPNIRAYLNRIAERAAFRTAMEKVEPGRKILLS